MTLQPSQILQEKIDSANMMSEGKSSNTAKSTSTTISASSNESHKKSSSLHSPSLSSKSSAASSGIKKKQLTGSSPNSKSKTHTWLETEEWQRDNSFILSGYRFASDSYLRSIKSLIYLHNESVNLYTHLFGAIVAFCAAFVLALSTVLVDSSVGGSSHKNDVNTSAAAAATAANVTGISRLIDANHHSAYHDLDYHRHYRWRSLLTNLLQSPMIVNVKTMIFANNFVSEIGNAITERIRLASSTDIIVFAIFFLSATICLGLSSWYHTMSNHSKKVHLFANRLDYLGIVVLIWGSFVPTLYYGLCDDSGLTKAYWTMISLIGIGCAVVSIAERFSTPQWRPFRAIMFVSMGLFGIMPVVHGLIIHVDDPMRFLEKLSIPFLVEQGGLYILGAVIYALRVPERFYPGKFDIWGSSHQIFHVCVLCAATVHFIGLARAFDYHHSNRQNVGM